MQEKDEVTKSKQENDQLKVSLVNEREKCQNLENKLASEKSRRLKVKKFKIRMTNHVKNLKKNLQKEKELGREIKKKSKEENSRLQKVQYKAESRVTKTSISSISSI